jgi:hypothetical protein
MSRRLDLVFEPTEHFGVAVVRQGQGYRIDFVFGQFGHDDPAPLPGVPTRAVNEYDRGLDGSTIFFNDLDPIHDVVEHVVPFTDFRQRKFCSEFRPIDEARAALLFQNATNGMVVGQGFNHQLGGPQPCPCKERSMLRPTSVTGHPFSEYVPPWANPSIFPVDVSNKPKAMSRFRLMLWTYLDICSLEG